MSSTKTSVKFVVGSRVLLSVPKDLTTLSFSLADVVGGKQLTLPELTDDQDGFRVLSAPAGTLSTLGKQHPDFVIGGVQQYERHYIDMAGSFDEYLARFSSKTRSTLRRKHRKLIKDIGGEVEFREYRTPDEMDEFRDLALPLSRRTYQAKSLDAGLPESDEAHEERRHLASADKVRAYLLCVDGQPISYLYLPVIDDTIVYAFLGYDPDHAKFSPGTVLQLEALERLFAEGRYRYFDFTEGEGAHKAMFGTDAVNACSFFMMKKGLTNRMLLSSVDAFDAGVAHIKAATTQSGTLAKARQLLRA
ncbi:GNAT family N-acetyltransferase [Altererythrobacter sp. RZ02]|uniref:GNAT family N-acetyltransferase n=1 Tax=Pontixanthobacter rizhaonensis TaxID=2730337 RepID=A0A848QDR7_9SPHN|nr:GNAT family N-acetyltransferase [Pontixanthobacter rizhaonensis]NMW30562.1 GNAT family N-acetyltransferase [Pontixanthobacter rizhaonensis]